jgi:hypothetical protein
MARKFDIEVLIGANDRASSKLKKVTLATAAIATAAVAAAAVLTVAAFKAAKAAGVQELQETKLAAALRNVESASEDGAEKLIALAGALQKTTGFADEQTIAAQAMLATFQLNEIQIAAITPRLLDMAAATEKASGEQADLQAIAIALGKGFTGQAGQLSRYGVVLSDATKKSGDFNAILADLDKNFKGIAEESGETFIGKTRIMDAVLGDLVEKVGAQLIPVFETLIDIVSTRIIPVMEEWIKNNSSFVNEVLPKMVSALLNGLIPALEILFGMISLALTPVKALFSVLGSIATELDKVAVNAAKATAAFRTLSEERLALLKEQRDALLMATEAERKLASEGKLRMSEESADLRELHQLTQAIHFLEVDLADRKLQNRIDNNEAAVQNEIFTAERQKAIDIAVAASQDKQRKKRLKAMQKETAARIQMIDTIAGSMQAGFVSMLKAEDSFATSAKKLFAGVRDTILNMIAELITAEIARFAVVKILGIKEAQTKAVAAHANIPIFGLAIGLAAAAALASAIGGFANGVRNFGGGLAIVGERGPELVDLSRGSSVISNTQTRGVLAGAGGGGLTFIFTGNTVMGDNAIEEFSDIVSDNIMSKVKNLINVS